MHSVFPGTRLAFLAALAIAGVSPAAAAGVAAVPERRPVPLHEQDLLSSDNPAANGAPYLAFPAVLDLGADVLISFKHGRAHARDSGASLDLLRLDPITGKKVGPTVMAREAGLIMQMGEWVRFSNGDIANYIDAQQPTAPARVGLRVVRSTDGGRTFGGLDRMGVVDGVEYGYAFDAITEGRETWMLAMTFANLAGGGSISARRPEAGSVDVIHTDDNGRTWHRVAALTHEFGGIEINESAFVRLRNGFLVTTRGYDAHERLHLTDGQFHPRQEVDLTATYPFITSYVGRPRLFTRGGHAYLLGRNWSARGNNARDGQGATTVPRGVPMQLALFRLDAGGLRVESYAILDNADARDVTDGYYAMGVFRGEGTGTRFHVVTYRGLAGKPPGLIELEFRWSDVE